MRLKIKTDVMSAWKVVCLALLMAFSFGAMASDIAREKRLADQIIDAILDGEPIFLNANGHEFLAIHMESEVEKPKGAVIILHGRGYHPDWHNVAGPVRKQLPEHGWHTLSLQMPVLHKEAKYYDYEPVFAEAAPRIEAGIHYLQQQGVKNIVLLAHSCGAHMAMQWLKVNGDRDIVAYVGIGMGATDLGQPMREPFALDKLTVPVLDVYGADEYKAVKRMAPERWAAIKKAGNALSQQQVVSGADHYFNEKNAELIEVVAAWLDSLKLQ